MDNHISQEEVKSILDKYREVNNEQKNDMTTPTPINGQQTSGLESDFSGFTTAESNAYDVKKVEFSEIKMVDTPIQGGKLNMLYDVPLELSVVLGKVRMPLREVLSLNVGKVIGLEKYSEEPLEIYVNGKLIAEGEVVVVDDNFAVKVTNIISLEDRIRHFK